MTQTKSEFKKLLIMGLDNSGKSSILLSLRENTNILSYFSLRPTKGVKIETYEEVNPPMSIWDFGGQEQYRSGYLENFTKYLTGVEKIIFTIDVQDMERYGLAINYLRNILETLKKLNEKVEFSIFLHKLDPNLTKKAKFKDLEKKIDTELILKINELIPPECNCKIFRTTIYTVFEKTLA